MKKKKKKKILYAYLIKNTVISWTRLKTTKLVATVKQLLFVVWKIRQFFFSLRANVQIGLTFPPIPPRPPVPVRFRSLYTDLLPPRRTYFLNAPCWCKKLPQESRMSAQDITRKYLRFFRIRYICLMWYILTFLTDIRGFPIKRKIQVHHVPSCTTGYSCIL